MRITLQSTTGASARERPRNLVMSQAPGDSCYFTPLIRHTPI